MDCFVEPVIGRRFAPTRWLAMTISSLPLRFPLLRRLPLLRSPLQDFLSLRPRPGKGDRDRLLAARDGPAGPAALQRARLALLHRASDLGRGFPRVFSCHDYSPNCGKIIFAAWESSGPRLAR